MDEPGHLKLVQLGPERLQSRVVEVRVVQAGRGGDAVQPQLLDGPLQLVGGGLAVLERDRGERRELAGVLALQPGELLVVQLAELESA
jgi:hypothetical protein